MAEHYVQQSGGQQKGLDIVLVLWHSISMSKRLKPNESSINLQVRMPLSMYRALKVLSTRHYSCGEMVRAAVDAWLKTQKTHGQKAGAA